MDTCMRKEGLDYEADVGDLFGRPGVSLGLEPPRDLGGSSRWHTALPLWLAPEKQPRASSAPHARGQVSLSPASTRAEDGDVQTGDVDFRTSLFIVSTGTGERQGLPPGGVQKGPVEQNVPGLSSRGSRDLQGRERLKRAPREFKGLGGGGRGGTHL